MSSSPNFFIYDALLGRVEANFWERLETCVRDNSRLLGHEVFKIRVNRVIVFLIAYFYLHLCTKINFDFSKPSVCRKRQVEGIRNYNPSSKTKTVPRLTVLFSK